MFKYITGRKVLFNGVRFNVELPNGRKFAVMSHDDTDGGRRGQWEILETTNLNVKYDVDSKYHRACAAWRDNAFHTGWMTPKEVEKEFEFLMKETYEQYMNDVA